MIDQTARRRTDQSICEEHSHDGTLEQRDWYTVSPTSDIFSQELLMDLFD